MNDLYNNWPPNITHIVNKTRHALFGHIVRLDSGYQCTAHQALKQVIAVKAGRCSGTNWRRPPGCPRKTWIQQIGDGTTTSWKQTWQSADCGHRGESSQWITLSKHYDDDDDMICIRPSRSANKDSDNRLLRKVEYSIEMAFE